MDRYEANLESAIRAAVALGNLNTVVKPRNKDELLLIKELAAKAGYDVVVRRNNDIMIGW